MNHIITVNSYGFYNCTCSGYLMGTFVGRDAALAHAKQANARDRAVVNENRSLAGQQ